MSPIPIAASLSDIPLIIGITGTVERVEGAQYVDDVAISSLTYTALGEYIHADGMRAQRRLIHHDLLEGVDTSCADVQILLSNLLSLIAEEANEALFEAASE